MARPHDAGAAGAAVAFIASKGFDSLSNHLTTCGYVIMWVETILDPRCRMTMWRCRDATVVTQDFGEGGSCQVYACLGSSVLPEVKGLVAHISGNASGLPTLH